jgi:hypothetical protein
MQWRALVLTELNVAHMGGMRNAYKRLVVEPEDKNRLKEIRITGRIIL